MFTEDYKLLSSSLSPFLQTSLMPPSLSVLGNESFESVEHFKYLGTNLTHWNCIHAEIKSRLNFRKDYGFVNVTLHCLLDGVLWNIGTCVPRYMPSYPRRLYFRICEWPLWSLALFQAVIKLVHLGHCYLLANGTTGPSLNTIQGQSKHNLYCNLKSPCIFDNHYLKHQLDAPLF